MDKKLILTRLHSRFAFLVREYMFKHGMTQQKLADKVGMQRSHLNALLMGKQTRPLSAYYLFKFILKGVIKVAEIYDGASESDRETDFWDTAKEAENVALLKRIARMRRKGYDIEKILDAVDVDLK